MTSEVAAPTVGGIEQLMSNPHLRFAFGASGVPETLDSRVHNIPARFGAALGLSHRAGRLEYKFTSMHGGQA